MTKIWTFGDSYIHNYDFANTQYMDIVAKEINAEHMPHGLNGTSVSYAAHEFNKCRNHIKHNDIVVIALTNVFRRWYFKDRPKETALYANVSASEKNAIKNYQLYLNNDLEDAVIAVDFLYNLHYATEQKNLHTIILTCFEDTRNLVLKYKNDFPMFNISIGTLEIVSFKECSQHFLKQWLELSNEAIGESRLNHLIQTNHYILADKILNNLKTNTPIDLTKDFEYNVIDLTTKNYTEFHKKEFFGNPWMFGI
jgi:hypothetical protein